MKATDFMDIVNGKKTSAQIRQQQAPVKKVDKRLQQIQAANQKTKGILTVLDQIDLKAAKLIKQKKEQEKANYEGNYNPDIDKELDRLSSKRGEFAAGLGHPAILANINLSNYPNSEVFMKTVDPRVYEELDGEERMQLRETANAFDRIERGEDVKEIPQFVPKILRESETPRTERTQQRGIVSEATQG